MNTEAVATFESKIDGRNAPVTIWPDRIEYQTRGIGSHKARSTILLRQVSSLATEKDGVGKSAVVVRAGAVEVRFRQKRELALDMHDRLLELMRVAP